MSEGILTVESASKVSEDSFGVVPCRHRVLTSFAAAAPHQAEWDALARAHADTFGTFSWCNTWWEHFGAGRRLEIHLFWENERLTAVLPLLRHTLWTGIVPLRMIELVGCNQAVAAAGLSMIPEQARSVTNGMLAALADDDSWDVFSLGPFCSHMRAARTIGQTAARNAAADAVLLGEHAGCSAVYDLPATYDEYLARMPGHERRNVLRCERLLHQERGVTACVATSEAERRDAIDALVRLHGELWGAKGRPGQFVEWPGFELFFRDIAIRLGARDQSVLVTLKRGTEILGVEAGYLLGAQAHAQIRGYCTDRVWERYSLGRALHCAFVHEGIRRGARTLDDGAGEFEYKHRLGANYRCRQAVYILRRGFWPRLRLWLATEQCYFWYGFCRRIWIYKLRRLGRAERPLRPYRLRTIFLLELRDGARRLLFDRRRLIRMRCPRNNPWCAHGSDASMKTKEPETPPATASENGVTWKASSTEQIPPQCQSMACFRDGAEPRIEKLRRTARHALRPGRQAIRFVKSVVKWMIQYRPANPTLSLPFGTRPPAPCEDLQPGDRVRVRSLPEIRLTLDHNARCRGCAFLGPMHVFVGQEFVVLRRVDRFFDEARYRMLRCRNVVLLEGCRCEGRDGNPDTDGCDRMCYFFWRTEWLERVASSPKKGESAILEQNTKPISDVMPLAENTCRTISRLTK